MDNNLNLDFDLIEQLVKEEVNAELQSNVELVSSIDYVFLIEDNPGPQSVLEALKNYGDENENMGVLSRLRYKITWPYAPESQIPTIKAKSKVKIPTLLITVENKMPKHRGMLNDFVTSFQNDTPVDYSGSKIIIRFESYFNGIKAKQYVVGEDKTLVFEKDVINAGDNFLPLIN